MDLGSRSGDSEVAKNGRNNGMLAKSIERLNIQGEIQQRSSKEMKQLLSNVSTEIAQTRFHQSGTTEVEKSSGSKKGRSQWMIRQRL